MNTLISFVGVNLESYFRNQLTLLSLVGVNLEFSNWNLPNILGTKENGLVYIFSPLELKCVVEGGDFFYIYLF